MSKRPALEVTAPDFGGWLKDLRGDRSLEQLAIQLRPLVAESGQKVNRTTLHQFEQGRVPNWPMLAAYAVFFDVPLVELLHKLAQKIEFPGSRDLLSQTRTIDSPPQPKRGGDAEKTTAHIRQLEEDISIYRSILKRVADLGNEIATTAAVHRKGASAAGGKSARRGHS